MATYQDIKGLRVKYLSSDPGTLRLGEVWYNSTTGTLKTRALVGAWSSGGSLSGAVYSGGVSSRGTQTATYSFMGSPPQGSKYDTEDYNGTSWTNGPSTPISADGVVSAGTQTAALAGGGQTGAGGLTTCIEWDSSSWTAGGSLPFATIYTTGGGTQTAAITMGGFRTSPPASSASIRTYNGSSWSVEGTSLPSSRDSQRQYGESSSSQNVVGGWTAGSIQNKHENWNGTTVTTLTGYPTALSEIGTAGTVTAGLCFTGDGYPAPKSLVTSTWDGSAWTAAGDYPTAITSVGGSGSTTAGLSFGGYPGATATNHYDLAASTQTLTTS